MEFKPVCAVTGKGDLEIFSNSCFAYQAGAVEVQFEQCKGPVEKWGFSLIFGPRLASIESNKKDCKATILLERELYLNFFEKYS
jgi:hypothetical protein